MPKKSTTKQPKSHFSLSATAKKQLSIFTKEFDSKNISELKEVLLKNDQARTGNKKVLVAKCAQGKLLGAIPRCPSCFGGRPTFDIKTGIYSCSGYMQDDKFKNCFEKFDSLVRKPWV